MNTDLEKSLLSCHEFSENLKKWLIVNKLPMATDYPFSEELKVLEEEQAEEDDWEEELPPEDIIAFNELRSCHELCRMVGEKQIIRDPDFQRGNVWTSAEKSRFVDSLIKGLPIPSLCISYDGKTNERVVIDGRQRIETIIGFLSEPTTTISNVEDINKRIRGKTAGDIKKDENSLYKKVENLMIPVTVIRCDASKEQHLQYLYKIFHRLNTGGQKLSNQEIRNCIYSGKFNKFLKETVKYPNYRALMGMQDKYYKQVYEELNLRVFALYDGLDQYNGKLSNFLNKYMYVKSRNDKNPDLEKQIEAKNKLFQDSVDLIYNKLFYNNSLRHLSKAVIEALFIAVFSNIEALKNLPKYQIEARYVQLLALEVLNTNSLKENLGNKDRVKERIKQAIDTFKG